MWCLGLASVAAIALVFAQEEGQEKPAQLVFQRSSILGIYAYYGDMSALPWSATVHIMLDLIPALLAEYANISSIYQLTQIWNLPLTTCSTQSVPIDHQTLGLPNVDVVLYISASADTASSYLVQVETCAFDGNINAIAVTMKFNAARYASMDIDNEREFWKSEIAHILNLPSILALEDKQFVASALSTKVMDSGQGLANHQRQCINGECDCDEGYSGADCNIRCDKTCKTCSNNSPEYCLSCFEHMTLTNSGTCISVHSTRYLGVCHPTCATCQISAYDECLTCTSNAVVIYGTCTCNSGYGRSIEDQTKCISCHLTCTLCSGLTSSLCLACTVNATLVSGACVCNSGYGRSTDQVKCVECHPSCAVCSAAAYNQCSKCPSNANLVSGTCVCNPGYIQSSDQTTCLPCHPSCVTCSGTAINQCLSCNSTAKLTSGTCVCNSGLGRSSDQKNCIACHPTCASCSAEAYNQCLTCFSFAHRISGACVCDYGYGRSIEDNITCIGCVYSCYSCSEATANGRCLTCDPYKTNNYPCLCLSNYLLSPSKTSCLLCHPTCATCSGTFSNKCVTCTANATLVSGECVCDPGYGRSSDQVKCVECHPSCAPCSATAYNQCSKCPSNANLVSGTCVCNPGYIQSYDQTACLPCHPSCVTCSGTTNNQCLSCNFTAKLTSGTCVCNSGLGRSSDQTNCIACHPACVSCSFTGYNKCLTCTSNATLISDTCVCNSGYGRSTDQTKCLLCHPACITCFGIANNQCFTCASHSTLVSDECVCNSGYGRSSDKVKCVQCHPKCATCSATAYDKCVTCVANSTILSDTCECNSGYMRSSDQTACIACYPICVTCSGTSNNQCLSCSSNATLKSGACQCNSGYFWNIDLVACMPCHPSCLTCSVASNQCLTCGLNAVNISGSCSCNAGYFRSVDQSQCIACHLSCLTCTSQDFNCTSCKSHSSLNSGVTVGACNCVQGYYALPSWSCEACDMTCKTCLGPAATQCISCYFNVPDVSGRCKCAPGLYRTQAGSCASCSANCLSCETTATTCTSCDPSVASLSNTSCQCLSSAFLNSSNMCQSCHPSCASCSAGAANNCLSCGSNATKSATGTCNCNSTYYMTSAFKCALCSPLCFNCTGSSANQCLSCRPAAASVMNGACICSGSQYLSGDGTTCLSCYKTCSSCNGGGANMCLSCYPQGVLTPLSGPGTCTCASGKFYDPPVGCTDCHFSCKECNGSLASNCLSCYPGTILLVNICVCTSGYVLSLTSNDCIKCSANCKECANTPSNCTLCDNTVSSLSSNTCVCLSSAFLSQSSACVPCHATCLSCSGATITSCLSCFPRAFRSELYGGCLCNAGTFPNPSASACSQCDSSCKLCSGPGPEACTECISPAALNTRNACACPEGYAFTGLSDPSMPVNCAPCHSSCLSCSGISIFNCLACPVFKVLIDNMYCGSTCPSGQIATNGICQTSSSPIFNLKLNTNNLLLQDTVAQAIVQPSTALAPPTYYQQGSLFDGKSHYLRLPPTSSEPERNLMLDATHSTKLWIRPTAGASFSCLISKNVVTNQTVRPQLQLCVTDTALLQLQFYSTSLADASIRFTNFETIEQVPMSRSWIAVGYQFLFRDKNTTVVELFIERIYRIWWPIEGVFYQDFVGNADTVQLLVGAGLSSYQSYDYFYKGSIAEISLYNSQRPADVSTCSCSFCTSSNICLTECFSNEYFHNSSCFPCPAACSNGCLRGADCRANVDPLCTVFTSFEGCTTCGDLAEMTTSGCKCTASALVSSSDNGNCICIKGYGPSGSKCVPCFSYFTAEQVTARFDSSFLNLIVTFSKPVDISVAATCNRIFLNSTLMKLGIGYDCAWSHTNKTLNVHLGTNFSLISEPLFLDYSTLHSSIGNCSYAAVPLIPVALYPLPLPQVSIKLIVPHTYSKACSVGQALNLDGSGTKGGKGRNMTFAWSITSNPALATLIQYKEYRTTNPILSIQNALLDTTVLNITLTVTNFLGTKATTFSAISVIAGEAISLQIDGGNRISTSTAVKTQVKVNPISRCKTLSLNYTWSFIQTDPTVSGKNFGFLSSPSPPNKLSIPAYALSPGSSYTFQVSASDGRNVTSLAFIIDVTELPLIAALNLTDTDISATKALAISGKESSDPNKLSGDLKFAWSCLEGTSVCIDSHGKSVITEVGDSVLILQASQLKVEATWNITLTVSKGIRFASKSVLITIKAEMVADFILLRDFPTLIYPHQIIQLIFAVTSDKPTTFQWSQSYGKNLTLLTPTIYPFLTIAADCMQSGMAYGLSLTATNTEGQATAKIYFSENYAPSGGTASISPTEGVAFKTIFEEVNSGWEDTEQNYPLTYQLTNLYKNRQIALTKRLLSSSLAIKGGPGTYFFIAYIYDALGTYVAVPLPVVNITISQRLLQSAGNVFDAFLLDTINTDQTYAMVWAYSTAYQFDNSTYIHIVSALQAFVSQLDGLDETDIDACISSIGGLFLQTAQMNADSLDTLFSLLNGALVKYQKTLTDSQLTNLVAVIGEYPGTSDEERSLIQAFLKTIMSDSVATALPDQAPAVYASSISSHYARRVSVTTLNGMSAASGSTIVIFPSNITAALGLNNATVVDVHVGSQSFWNSTSDQVDVSLTVAGQFVSYSFQVNATLQTIKNLSSPIQLTVKVNNINPNETYQCEYKDAEGNWQTQGINLTAISAISALCESNFLSTFQVIKKRAFPIDPPPNPPKYIPVEDPCGSNFAPIAIVSAVALFGLIISLAFRNCHIKKYSSARVASQVNYSRAPINMPEISQGNGPEADQRKSIIRIFLGTHYLTGLFVKSKNLTKWMKAASWTAELTAEMAFIGTRYTEEDEDRSEQSLWTGYDERDFVYSLSALGVGLGVGVVLTAVFTVAIKKEKSLGRTMKALGCIIVVVVLAAAVGGTIYMDLDLCSEQEWRWAIRFLVMLLGDVVICQTCVVLAHALVLRMLA